jgi:hypothetical protein
LSALPSSYACRVAPDELWLVAPPELLADTERCAAEHFSRTDPTALVLDQSDGWTTFTLRGNEGLWVFAQLSAIPLPSARPAFVQGAVAGGAAKVLLLDGVVHVLVPLTLRHHLTARLHDVSGIAFISSGETPFLGDETTLTSPMRLSMPALR